MILEVCHFPLERFFASNIQDWKINDELQNFFANLSFTKKRNIVELLKELRSS